MSTAPTTGPPASNHADRRYLTESLAALGPAVELSNVAAVQGADAGVRTLARSTLAGQSRLIRDITDCLDEQEPRSAGVGAAGHRTTVTSATAHLRGLDGADLDRSFVAQLTSYVDVSLTRARTQMVDGLNPRARGIAEATIREHRQDLAAIAVLTSS